MLLAPRQLQRNGMTGAVPYYGGRLTPAHIYGDPAPGCDQDPHLPPRHRRPLRLRSGTSGRRRPCSRP